MDLGILAVRDPVAAPDPAVPVVERSGPPQPVVLLTAPPLGEARLVREPDGPRLLQFLQRPDQTPRVGGPVLGLDPVPGAQMIPGRPVTVGGEPLQAFAQRVPPLSHIAPWIADLSRKTPETGHGTATSVARTSASRDGRTTALFGSIQG